MKSNSSYLCLCLILALILFLCISFESLVHYCEAHLLWVRVPGIDHRCIYVSLFNMMFYGMHFVFVNDKVTSCLCCASLAAKEPPMLSTFQFKRITQFYLSAAFHSMSGLEMNVSQTLTLVVSFLFLDTYMVCLLNYASKYN